MTVDSSDCAKPEEPVWFCLKAQPKREHLVASGLRKQFGIVCFAPRLRLRKLTRRGPVWFVEAMRCRHWHPLAFLLLWPIRPLICSIIPARSSQLTTIGKTRNRRKFRRRDWPRRIISRPPLASFGVATPLADPTLSLRDANGNVIASNDNWKDSQQADIAATGKAPPNDHESAILALLAPGNYTAIVAGKNGTTGVALMEFYGLP